MVSVQRVESSRSVESYGVDHERTALRSTQRVLFVDDEADLVDLLVDVARNAGFSAGGTTDPLEMLAACERASVDVVVVDLRMPEVDGIELLRSIAQSARAPAVVLMSGSDASVLETARSFVETLGLRVRGVMPKPFSPKDMISLLDRRIDGRLSAVGPERVRPSCVELPARLADSILAFVQPQVSFVDGRIVGYEALARLRSSDGSVLGPDAFLPEIRRHERMRELTVAVLDAALAGLSPLRREGLVHAVSINVPADVLAEHGFVDEIFHRLRIHDMPPFCLTLELTEDEVVRQDGPTLGAMVRLRLAGVGLAIDDFGTGHSTLSQTRNVPATELKLDRSFVVDLDSSPRAHAIVRNICRMGRELGLRVVAEGIESNDVAVMLASAGCTAGQGYLYGRPIPIETLMRALGSMAPRVAKEAIGI